MKYPIIPLRDVVIYPGIITPLFVGRKNSIAAIEAATKTDMQIILVAQKAVDMDNPTEDDIYPVGTLADIIQIMRLPDGTLKLLIEGHRRVKINTYLNDALTECQATFIEEILPTDETVIKENRQLLLQGFQRYVQMLHKQPNELLATLKSVKDLSLLADTIASHLHTGVAEKIVFLQQADLLKRIIGILQFIEKEISVLDLEHAIRQRVKVQMDKNQKEYYLNEQAKAIQKELEDLDESKTDFGQLEKAIKTAKMPKVVEEKCLTELDKLKRMSSLSSEAGVLRTYIETMTDYPWSKTSKTDNQLADAKAILEASHHGLEEVKKRIIEYLAVQQRLKKSNGSILCLVGPPGVGKTSIGKSIAKAVNRKYVRMALGGMRDEAEIRGHRRTYIGALPGKIVQNISKSKVNNPLFLLDEIDKMGMDHRGDPASAMLEVLDPEQNHTFNDHYMEVDIDLSNVMFIATANSLDIPEPLLDRMEIIRIPGYTESEKMAIGKKYLLPRNIKRHGLKSSEINITDRAMKMLVENYTREAGVRSLDREIGKLCRKVVTQITLENVGDKVSISKNNLASFLGPAKYQHDGIAEEESIGRITGLAWTSVGGELLNIEIAILPGKGKVSLTGKLGDVMQESVQAAMTVVKSHVVQLGIASAFFQEHDFHIHFPEAATPKDGPSAGIAIATALLSAVMQSPISNRIAMTGEVTLQGNVLAIGGLKEKLFAASREGIKTVFIPKANEKDLVDIPAEITNQIKIKPVKKIEQIFSEVFSKQFNQEGKTFPAVPLIEKYLDNPQSLRQKH